MKQMDEQFGSKLELMKKMEEEKRQGDQLKKEIKEDFKKLKKDIDLKT